MHCAYFKSIAARQSMHFVHTAFALLTKYALRLPQSIAVSRTASLPPDHTFLQQLRKVGKRSRSPANLLIQFQPHLVIKPARRAHPCAHLALSRRPVWPFDKAQQKSGKLESRESHFLRLNSVLPHITTT